MISSRDVTRRKGKGVENSPVVPVVPDLDIERLKILPPSRSLLPSAAAAVAVRNRRGWMDIVESRRERGADAGVDIDPTILSSKSTRGLLLVAKLLLRLGIEET